MNIMNNTNVTMGNYTSLELLMQLSKDETIN